MLSAEEVVKVRVLQYPDQTENLLKSFIVKKQCAIDVLKIVGERLQLNTRPLLP